jgi:hypothetical protein
MLGLHIFGRRGDVFKFDRCVPYLIDEFGDHAASANAVSRMLSNVMDFTVALFVPQLYKHLSYGWGNSLLAMLYIAIGWPALVLLWKCEYSCGPLGGRIENLR